MSAHSSEANLLTLTARIVAAHVAHNQTQRESLSGLIRAVYVTLSDVGNSAEEEVRPAPAVPIKKSVFPSYIICLEDGKKLKTLKRHLNTSFQMTPDEYRKRWNLPADYPMVAPDYASRRSAIARSLGLGHKRKATPQAAKASAPGPAPEATATAAPAKKRGRKTKIAA